MVVACCTWRASSPEPITVSLIKTVSAFLLIICRSLEIRHSFKMWLNDNFFVEIFANFSKTAEKWEKLRHSFEDSFNMNNILNWKVNWKINSMRPWSSRKAEFLSKIASFLPLKLEHANYIFPISSISFTTFYDSEEYWFWMFR